MGARGNALGPRGRIGLPCVSLCRRVPFFLSFAMLTRVAAFVLLVAGVSQGQTTVSVSFDSAVREAPATGRLVLYTIRDGAPVGSESPADGPFAEDPQPLIAVDVKELAPGAAAKIDDGADAFPATLSKLPQGKYRLQAVLDLHSDNSSWKREPGNLYSDPVTVVVGAADGPVTVPIKLTHAVVEQPLPKAEGVEFVSVRSKLLSEFRGHDVMLRAGVVLPVGYDAKADRKYAAVYEVPGFGGDHRDVARMAVWRKAPAETPIGRLARNIFWIVLDPESGNGHTLFADSANNGPCARALIEELIPAIEARYRLDPRPAARLLRGHSSGGWSTLWLALNYPQTFGATWSTSPDPVDFRRFQLIDIYGQRSFYSVSGYPPPDSPDTPQLLRLAKVPAGLKPSGIPDGPEMIVSYRLGGRVLMTVEQEARGEDVLGPDNTSGQQWDSWFAVFGPRNAAGHPAALFDPKTGVIDRAVAEQFRKYDIAGLLRANPEKYGPLFLQRVRLIVGDQDNYFLNEAVSLLKPELEGLKTGGLPEGRHGYIKIVPGADHGSVAMSADFRAIPEEMMDHLARNKLVP